MMTDRSTIEDKMPSNDVSDSRRKGRKVVGTRLAKGNGGRKNKANRAKRVSREILSSRATLRGGIDKK